jgi:CheY-like chemotaxis protein
LRVTLPVVPVPVRADTVRMTQVVLNLLDNACKFTPPAGVISLTVEREDERARISVRDSGAGIAAGELPRLFQMFYQSDTGTAPSQGGLGIGLSLVKLIVEMHHGSVEATSEGPGLGSEFVVRLPVAEAARKSVEPRPAADGNPVESTGRRILVVDDNEDNAESLAMLLRRHGHEVRTAYDGGAAVVLADTFGAEVVLLDIGLPMLDGYQAARAIREQPWGKAITLVAVTGWGQENDRQRSREAGFDAHLVKPVDLAELMKLVLAPASETR